MIIAILLQLLLLLPLLSDFLYFTMSFSTILQTKGLTRPGADYCLHIQIIAFLFDSASVFN